MLDSLFPVFFWVFAGAFVSVLFATPYVMRLAAKTGAVDAGGYRKIARGGTPLMGGLAIALPFMAVCLFCLAAPESLLGLSMADRHRIGVFALANILILAIGAYDDIKGMRARYKFLGQIAVALLICSSGQIAESIPVPFLGRIDLGLYLGIAFTVLWIVGITNAFNIIDGLDGLAAGLAFIGAVALGIIGWLNGSTLAVILCFTLAGGLLAFLKYNFHPARIFLGDTGSLFLGFSLATISIISSHKTAGTVILLAPMLALGVPLFETLVSIARRYMRGVPIFCADSRHTHHRLLQRGFSQRQAVLILYACALACLVAAVLALSGSTDLIVFSGVGVYAAAMLAIGVVAGYIQIEPIREIVKRRSRNAMLTAFAQYAGAKINNASSKDQLALILNLMRMELELAFLDLEYGEERVRVAGANSSAKSIAAGKKERVSFKNANGFEISLTYRIETERPSEAQKEDTAACLAGALSCVQPNTFLGAAAIRMAREMAEREQTLEAAKASSQPKRQFAPVGGASTASVA